MSEKSPHTYLRYIVFSALCIGCIVPVSMYTPDSRRNVREETALMLIPGQTTKEEVYLTLGAPDEVSPDGRQLIYNWAKEKALVGIAPYAPPTPIVQKSSLIITFDERGVVVQREIQKKFPVPW
jgi:outer membrane protein assembly factor BamE (lipoprotein component of BamABCDE complex)